jgi:hypothetical protein
MNSRENIAYLKYFGPAVTLWKTINHIFVGYRQGGKIVWMLHDVNNNVIEKYLKRVCPISYKGLQAGDYDGIDDVSPMTSYRCENSEELINNVIWTMWWQGEENAPPIVKKCIESMRKHSNGHQVVVLSEDNFQQYVKLPKAIIDRFTEHKADKTDLKNITLDQTKISDVVRTYLLYYYGGVWSDATMFFTKDIDELFFNDKWETLGQDNTWYIGRGRWSTFFMSAKAGNAFCKFNYDMHIEYWTNRKYYVNYLMTDHMFDIAYKERSKIRNMVDSVRCGNNECLTINRKYDQPVNRGEAEAFLEKQYLHKLSWKWWGRDSDAILVLKTSKGDQTWLGYLLENFCKED